MSKEYKDLVVGLDIGTSKISSLVAEVRPDGSLNVIGLGTHPSTGLRRGVVVNIEATVAAISRASTCVLVALLPSTSTCAM